jgi:hypothetical protein
MNNSTLFLKGQCLITTQMLYFFLEINFHSYGSDTKTWCFPYSLYFTFDKCNSLNVYLFFFSYGTTLHFVIALWIMIYVSHIVNFTILYLWDWMLFIILSLHIYILYICTKPTVEKLTGYHIFNCTNTRMSWTLIRHVITVTKCTVQCTV